MQHSIKRKRAIQNAVSTVQVLGFSLILLSLTVALPQRANAESIKNIEIECRPGKQTVNVEPGTTKVAWVLMGCICWMTKEQAKDQILAAVRGGATAERDFFDMVFAEDETVKTGTLYCYSSETFNVLKAREKN